MKMDKRVQKYFYGELSLAERMSFLREVDSDEELKKQFAEYQNLYALMNLSTQLEDRATGKSKYNLFVRNKQHTTLSKRWIHWLGYAAAIIAVAVSSGLLTRWYILQDHSDVVASEMNTLYTPAGQRARLVLQDGTEVWLNAKSKLVYPAHFAGKERRVRVEGEAFFNVAKDSVKPFIVSAENVDMKVLGTQFNVYCYPDAEYIKTSLLEGSVHVFFPGRENEGVLLKPNQQVTVSEGKMEVRPIELEEYFLWRKGVYAFKNEPLIDILKKLELYYDVKIVVEDPSMFRETYTGKFRQRDSLDDVFRVLQQIRHFKVRKDPANNMITLCK